MDKAELLEIFTREQRIEVRYPDIQREVDGSVIRHINLAGYGGFVIYSHLDVESVEPAISAQIDRFESVPQNFEWKVYDYDTPEDLIERLRQRGFEIGEAESLVVLDLTARPEALERPVPASVVRLTDPNEVDAIIKLENAVWGTDHSDLGERLKRDLQERPDSLSVYISYQEGQPASAAWIFPRGQPLRQSVGRLDPAAVPQPGSLLSPAGSTRRGGAPQGIFHAYGRRQSHEPADPGKARLPVSCHLHTLHVENRKQSGRAHWRWRP
jgi:hypothetical protein